MCYIYYMSTNVVKIEDPAETVKKQAEEIAKLKAYIRRLQRQLYGHTSEKIDFNALVSDNEARQQNLFEDEAAANAVPAVDTINGPSYEKHASQKDKHGRRVIPDYINRKKIIIDIPDEEKICDCGTEKVKIGEDISEELSIIPLLLVVNQYIRYKYACPKCPENGVMTGELPPHPIKRCIASPELIAHIIICKYLWHLPLHRQERIFEHYGIKLNRSTMCTWEMQLMPYLWNLWDAMKEEIKKSGYLQTDETPITVLDKNKNGKSGRGFLWPYTDGRTVLFEYQPKRGRVGPSEFLKGFNGFVQTDGWESAYGHLGKMDGIVRMECWAHARRELFEAKDNDSVFVTPALWLIHRMYVLERRMKKWELLDKRSQLRKRCAVKYLDKLKKHLEACPASHTPKSPVRKAVNYILKRWEHLTVYVEDSRLEIDNNGVERAIRPVAIGRKNWMFAGSDDGADKVALMFSLVNSCKMLGINPEEYLTDVLKRIADHPVNRITELTPAGWKAARDKSK